MADALYRVGMNLVYNKNPLEGTKYVFDETGVAIRIPFKEYIVSSNQLLSQYVKHNQINN